jgi:hypothetical protein
MVLSYRRERIFEGSKNTKSTEVYRLFYGFVPFYEARTAHRLGLEFDSMSGMSRLVVAT